jgi:hypothetical protein
MADGLPRGVVPSGDPDDPIKQQKEGSEYIPDGLTQMIIHPLAEGLPRGVVPSGDPDDPSYCNATSEARAVRLKGYGNAIDPRVAALFITSYTEAT